MKAQIQHNLDCSGAALFKTIAFMCLIGTSVCSEIDLEIPENITRRPRNDILSTLDQDIMKVAIMMTTSLI